MRAAASIEDGPKRDEILLLLECRQVLDLAGDKRASFVQLVILSVIAYDVRVETGRQHHHLADERLVRILRDNPSIAAPESGAALLSVGMSGPERRVDTVIRRIRRNEELEFWIASDHVEPLVECDLGTGLSRKSGLRVISTS